MSICGGGAERVMKINQSYAEEATYSIEDDEYFH